MGRQWRVHLEPDEPMVQLSREFRSTLGLPMELLSFLAVGDAGLEHLMTRNGDLADSSGGQKHLLETHLGLDPS